MNKKKPKCKCEKRLEYAEQIRRFEIELYWKRSAYFWAFIALAFAGYGAIQVNIAGAKRPDVLENLDFLLANVGFVASAAWFLVNRGSKYWLEHWETQVEEAENCVTGPLYKVVIARVNTGCRLTQWMVGATRLPSSNSNEMDKLRVTSVSKINQPRQSVCRNGLDSSWSEVTFDSRFSDPPRLCRNRLFFRRGLSVDVGDTRGLLGFGKDEAG